MTKIERRGGYREGAGRKPKTDHLVPIYFSIKTSDVLALGDKYEVRAMAERYIIAKAKKSKKQMNHEPVVEETEN
jgi:hypothetical protein